MGLLPKSENFFQYFENSARHIIEGANLLYQLVTHREQAMELAKRIKDIEHEADKITHETKSKLDTTFITPIDREDIHTLISRLDDVIDLIDGAASRLVLYNVVVPPKDLEALVAVLQKTAVTMGSAVHKFKDFKRSKEVLDELIEINRLENEGDQALRTAMVNLFANVKNPIEVIKLKEVYEDVESAIDRCEDVANVIEGIIHKNV